jgi:hypothetical protein
VPSIRPRARAVAQRTIGSGSARRFTSSGAWGYASRASNDGAAADAAGRVPEYLHVVKGLLWRDRRLPRGRPREADPLDAPRPRDH